MMRTFQNTTQTFSLFWGMHLGNRRILRAKTKLKELQKKQKQIIDTIAPPRCWFAPPTIQTQLDCCCFLDISASIQNSQEAFDILTFGFAVAKKAAMGLKSSIACSTADVPFSCNHKTNTSSTPRRFWLFLLRVAMAAPPWITLKAKAWWPPSSQSACLRTFSTIGPGKYKLSVAVATRNKNIQRPWTSM